MKIFVVMCFFAVQVSPVFATGVSEYFHYREGLKALESEQPQTALASFLKALESDPMNSKIHFSLGLSLLMMEKPDQAVKAFRGARQFSKTPTERFNASFNAGIAAGMANQLDEALFHYQDALEVYPQSREVKTNIELLIQQQQQQQQGGQGDSDNKQEKKDEQGDQQQNQPGEEQKQPQEPEKKKQPQKFNSEELTPNDVKNILEELKSQEQGIRAKEYEKGKKGKSGGKDW